MNYYERHLGDYAKDTAHLSMLEHGAYSLLLDRYYGTEQGIPEDQAHRVARARTKDEKAAVDAVLAEFFMLVDGIWVNNRTEEEIEKARGRISAAKENGKRGGRPKKNQDETQDKPSGLSLGSENETQIKALHTPDTTYQAPEERERVRATRLPPDWTPTAELFSFATGLGLTDDQIDNEIAKFRDYWTAQPGAKGRKTDWSATFRNWIRRCAEDKRPAQQRGNRFGEEAAALARASGY